MKHVPYNVWLTKYARKLRKASTGAEEKMWEILRKRRVLGYKFLRQKPIDNYIADFYCSKLLLVIELDGYIHNDQKYCDAYRTSVLNQYGILVLRYKNDDVIFNLSGVYCDLEEKIKARALFLSKKSIPK